MFKNQKAFTLIELMVTLSILAIVMALAIPSFKSSVANNRSAGAGGELVTALNIARGEAIKRGSYVTICASDNGTSCLSAGNWAKGWLIFADDATSATATPVVTTTPTDKVIRYWSDLPSTAVVTAAMVTVDTTATPPTTTYTPIDYLRFTGSGTLARAANDAKARVFDVSTADCKGLQKTRVTVGLAGMIGLSKVSCP